jgi:hypothetical protein
MARSKRNGRNQAVALTALLASGALAVGCEELPGTRQQQATVIGGVAGGLAGAALNNSNPLMGLLMGSAIGAGGGYLIGAKTDWFEDPDDAEDDARRSVQIAQERPATPAQARRAQTADINEDGFVTADELVAMEQAGMDEDEILERLRATNQVFDVSPEQARALRQAGVSDRVISQMPQINRERRDSILGRTR